jgi:uncharacterized protein (TIGR02453 family)
MKSKFPGFPAEALKFFRDLKKHNNREWFEAHKALYLDAIKKPTEQLASLVSAELSRFAPRYVTEPKKALYRIYRDTRFSPDKTPYKTHQAVQFYRGDLPKNDAAAFYFHFSHEEVGIGGGAYMPSPESLRAIRAHMMNHHARLRKILAGPGLLRIFSGLQGEKLARPPQGFPAGHPAMDLIQGKQWYFWREVDPSVASTPMLFVEIVTAFEVMAPAIEFLNEAVEGLHKQAQQKMLKMDSSWL